MCFPHQSMTFPSREAVARVSLPAKNGIFEPFIYITDHFAKTGSGQHRENSKKDAVFRTLVIGKTLDCLFVLACKKSRVLFS
jgi:hypothetical protein